MTFHEIALDATGNPLYELDMVEFSDKWYTIKKMKGDYWLVNDEDKVLLARIPNDELFLLEHFLV